ncbi:MAG TPA: hypothetical protein DIS78_02970 [Lachnospiraceae bacterium]|nr:hypothetical protein [Lachnospiraceae bacterium]
MNEERKVLNCKKAGEVLIILTLALYPLRHAGQGLDYWDVGYNCLNYLYPVLDKINPPAFFSTYLSIHTGHFFSTLPGGSTLLGMNLYCGLIISFGCCLSYVFMTRTLKFMKLPVFAGEVLMMSLCYSPAVILYNHLSNVLALAALICLYIALKDNRDIMLMIAGACLSINLFVRFSNLPQAAFILAVWIYVYRTGKDKKDLIPGILVRKTAFCLSGYLLPLIFFILLLSGIYGRGSYFNGITDLFSMTSDAESYKSSYMLKEMVLAYLKGMHRMIYIGAFCLIAAGFKYTERWNRHKGRALDIVYRIMPGLLSLMMLALLVYRDLLQFDHHHYAVVYLSAALFLDAAMLFALRDLISKRLSADSKLFAGLVLLQILTNSVGSNTGISVAMNSMFLSAPYVVCSLTDMVKQKRCGEYSYEISVVLCTAGAAFFAQCFMFGVTYVYQEGYNTGARNFSVTGNHVLSDIKMSEERASCLQDLTDYRNDNGLKGSEVITYGSIPSIAYYLEMTPAMMPWPDLESYSVKDMASDIKRIEEEIDRGVGGYPLVIKGSLHEPGAVLENTEKIRLMESFLDRYDYALDHSNDTFEVWRKE